jgi:hypothetical protein
MPITKESHYNPCFWTAYWNFHYYQNKKSNSSFREKPREQIIYSLNLKSNNILKLKVRNVFFDKNAGIARITKQEMLEYCSRNNPEEYDNLTKYFEENPSDIFFNFENIFTGIEKVIRESIENVIQTRTIKNLSEKTYISYFIFFQIIRNHNTMKQFENFFKSIKMKKFELFFNLKDTLSDQQAIFNLIIPILSSRWTLYSLKKYRLPLSDNPILIRPQNIMMALAPDLMIEVELSKKVPIETISTGKKDISIFKYIEFKKRTIENSSREIIFGEKRLLEKWQKSTIFIKHLT